MTPQHVDEESIFKLARKIASPTDRSEYLKQVCGDDEALLARVESLLEVERQEPEFLNVPPSGVAPTIDTPAISERPGTEIGNYKLLEQIGEGGMGLVFVAEQQRPVRRKVAIKIIKPGMNTKEVVARFQAERQALALMDHPNIAKVLDAGSTESGRPYFCMELVRGTPITEYCDRHQLSVRDRIELFEVLCRSVQHAHQKGIIHRDLKPSNVLVSHHDDRPVLKVIDFGIAKAVNQPLTEQTIYTRFNQIVGTLPYMSPEQAGLSDLDIDTRSDIYSLGVLLYELATGTTPFDNQRLHQVAYDEVCRILREEEPPRPSARISTLGDTASSVSTCRGTDPKKLCSQVAGDLDWIVMKALEKDRGRRYESADAFARDMGNFLVHQPVEARRPSNMYRMRKFVRRNFAAVSAVSTIALLVAFFGVFAVWNSQRLRQTRDQLMISNERYKLTLEKHKDALLEKVLMAAVSGEIRSFEDALRDAKQAGVKSKRLNSLRGLAAMFAGNDGQASAILETAVRENPDDATAWAILSWLYDRIGALDGQARAYRESQRIPPDDWVDVLLSGHAQVRVDPVGTVQRLQSVVDDHPNSVFARVLLADAQLFCAVASGEQRYAEDAMGHVFIAHSILPQNPFVLSVSLDAYTVAIVFRDQSNQDIQDVEQSAESIAAELRTRHQDYMPGCRARALFFANRERLQEAAEEWERFESLGGGDEAAGALVATLLRLGQYDAALDVDAFRPHVYMCMGDRENALRAVEDIGADETMFRRFWKHYVPAMCGQRDRAEIGWKEFQASNEDLPYWIDFPLRLFLKQATPDEILAEAGEVRQYLAAAHWFIALDCLASGDRESAKEHLEDCIARNCFMFDIHQWALAYKAQLDRDSNWPQCLSGQIDATSSEFGEGVRKSGER